MVYKWVRKIRKIFMYIETFNLKHTGREIDKRKKNLRINREIPEAKPPQKLCKSGPNIRQRKTLSRLEVPPSQRACVA